VTTASRSSVKHTLISLRSVSPSLARDGLRTNFCPLAVQETQALLHTQFEEEAVEEEVDPNTGPNLGQLELEGVPLKHIPA
jgi:hypothetical protein